MNNTQRNLWMALQLGYDATIREETVFIPITLLGVITTTEFNLEGSAEDREAAVIWLGERSVNIHRGSNRWGWIMPTLTVSASSCFVDGYTYKEALFSAIDWVMDNEDA